MPAFQEYVCVVEGNSTARMPCYSSGQLTPPFCSLLCVVPMPLVKAKHPPVPHSPAGPPSCVPPSIRPPCLFSLLQPDPPHFPAQLQTCPSLYLSFLCIDCPSTNTHMAPSLPSFKPLLKDHLLSEAFSEHLSKRSALPYIPHPLS